MIRQLEYILNNSDLHKLTELNKGNYQINIYQSYVRDIEAYSLFKQLL